MKITSVADAIAAMDYLHRRKLLCDKCGIKLALFSNVNNSRCEGCLPKHGEFSRIVPPNELERRLCEAVSGWLSDDSPDARTKPEGGAEPPVGAGTPGA